MLLLQPMRHLPNLLTLANLFCGCLSIALVLNAQPYLYDVNPSEPGMMWNWVQGAPLMFWGGMLILIAAFFDALDGLAARALNVFSPIGKDLDSLADLVSFGVAPAMIMYKLLWVATMKEPRMMDVDLLYLAPAFLIACFGALRLARFNVSTPQPGAFTGMPIPAAGIFIASFALTDLDKPGVLNQYLQYRWVLYAIIALVCWLMVSKIRFIKLTPSGFSPAALWPLLVVLIGGVAAFVILGYIGIAVAFFIYILVSLLAPKPVVKTLS